LGEALLRLLTLETLDSPLTPLPPDKIWTCVRAAAETMAEGDKVMVYCKGGMPSQSGDGVLYFDLPRLHGGRGDPIGERETPVARPEDGHYRK